MGKQIVRLTEGQLKQMVKNTAAKLLRETKVTYTKPVANNRVVRLTEGQLKEVIKESVKKLVIMELNDMQQPAGDNTTPIQTDDNMEQQVPQSVEEAVEEEWDNMSIEDEYITNEETLITTPNYNIYIDYTFNPGYNEPETYDNPGSSEPASLEGYTVIIEPKEEGRTDLPFQTEVMEALKQRFENLEEENVPYHEIYEKITNTLFDDYVDANIYEEDRRDN